jgi:hypothetical protein
MSQQSIHDALVERMTAFWAYGTSGGIAAAGWTMQEWYGLIGLIFMVLTFVINTYYRRKTYEHQVFMQRQAVDAVNDEERDRG